MVKQTHFDALIVGCGFGGIYQLHKLRELGLSTIAIDAAGDVGGTWFWNQYPGAMSDTESYIVSYARSLLLIRAARGCLSLQRPYLD